MKPLRLWEYGVLVLLSTVLLVSVAMASIATLPPLPKTTVKSPKVASSADRLNLPMVKSGTTSQVFVVVVPRKVITLAADFPSIMVTNDLVIKDVSGQVMLVKGGFVTTIEGLTAFIDTTTNIGAKTNWSRTSIPYTNAPHGGTFAIPFTNNGFVAWRAGYFFNSLVLK